MSAVPRRLYVVATCAACGLEIHLPATALNEPGDYDEALRFRCWHPLESGDYCDDCGPMVAQ